jgi:M6 family metalloprotease-like protein
MLRPVGKSPIEGYSDSDGRFKSDVSKKNLLGLDRPTPFSLPTGKNGVPLALISVAMDTLNVLALKVEFQREVPDNPKTTGDGTFDLRDFDQFLAEEGHYIDPTPHTSSYFHSHMEALRRYWYFASDKKLNLTWDVYPAQESLAFRLPETMSYYGSEGPWDDVRDQLGNFFIDAITLADSSAPEIDFSSYHSIIIFHAGADQQNNISFINDTPDDFFTGFLILAEPLPVDGGLNYVQEGLIVPETASQDNRVTAINAVLAHEFGHQLGLIDLYNTYTFLTQVGDFALMDNNGMSVGVQFPDIGSTVGGTLPVYPCAWSRAFLGFAIPRELTAGVDIELTAAALESDSTEVVKVPITDFEYFLVENRQIEADTLEPGYPFDNIIIGDSLTGVILGPGYAYFEGNDTVLVADAEYDRLLPGDGALIWHVDEYVAYLSIPGSEFNNYQTNSVQWDKDRRFLTLVEADGVIDFGGNYHRGFGSTFDFFRDGNNTALTPLTRPSSESNLGADTHIYITDFSVSDTLITFDLEIDWLLPGWPQMSHPQFNSAPVACDIDNDGLLEILATADNRLLIFRHDGEKFFANSDSIGLYGFDGGVVFYPWAVAAECDTTISGRPLPVDFDGDGFFEIAVSTLSGAIYVITQYDDDFDGRGDPVPGFSPLQVSDNPLISMAAVDFDTSAGMEIVITEHDGYISSIDGSGAELFSIDLGGTVLSSATYSTDEYDVIDMARVFDDLLVISRSLPEIIEIPPEELSFATLLGPPDSCHIAVADIDRDGGLPEIVAVISDAVILIDAHGSIKWRAEVDGPLGRPAIGDINADGFPEIVVPGDSRVYAFGYNGTLLTDFPINLALHDLDGRIEAQPVLGDVDDDGLPDIIIGLPAGGVYAFNFRSDRVGGFPLPSSFEIEKTSALADVDGDGDIDLLTVEGSGAISAWDISSSYTGMDVPWAFAGGDVFSRGYLPPDFEKPVVTGDLQMPEGSVFNYPNPASNSTAIRFYLSSESDVKIDVFDFMGERIESATMRGEAHTNNEYVWDCADVASGVYFCRVEADDGVSKEWRMIKIALAK